METTTKVALTIVLFTIVGFMLGPQAPLGGMIWPPNADAEIIYGAPSSGEVALLMAYGLLASIAFGVGIAFLLFGYPVVENANVSPGLARGAHLAITWFLVNWVPHDALHQSIGSMSALIGLEYGFHLTMQVAAVVLALFFVAALKRPAAPATQTSPDAAPAAAR